MNIKQQRGFPNRPKYVMPNCNCTDCITPELPDNAAYEAISDQNAGYCQID